MPLQIVRNDITTMQVDAIVNAANRHLMGGGGVDGSIHRAAGPELDDACRKLGGCETGQAKITPGFRLPAKYIIHTVGPVWNGGYTKEAQLLRSCYIQSLILAAENGCSSVAFPLISAGAYGYPQDQALQVAMDAIRDFLMEADQDLLVYLVVFNRSSFQLSRKLFANVIPYIDDAYAESHANLRRRQAAMAIPDAAPAPSHPQKKPMLSDILWAPHRKESHSAEESAPSIAEEFSPEEACAPMIAPCQWDSLEDALRTLDESFSQMVLRKIQEKGIKNSVCYKKANIDKKLFSKINNDVHYKPKKQTALALAIGLELSLDETRELLTKAGLAFSHSEKFDIIVEYFIRSHNYDIFEINEVLFYYDQPLLGNSVV